MKNAKTPELYRGMFLVVAAVLSATGVPYAVAEGQLTLPEAIRIVKLQSEEALLLVEKENRLESQKRELYAGALPQINFYANAGRGQSPFDPKAMGIDNAPIINKAMSRYAYGLEVTQPIYSFGRLGQAFDVAAKKIRSQNEANRRSRQQLELQTLEAFYGVITANARLRVLEASIKRQRETMGFLESNFKMGAGMRSTALLATAAFKALEPERIRAERDAIAARMAFNRLLGRPIEGPLDLDTTVLSLTSFPLLDTSEAGMNAQLDKRPDLNSLHLQKETMQGYAKGYRMLYRPSLGFQGKLGVLAYDPGQLTHTSKNLEYQYGVGLQWPLFDGLSNSSKAKQFDSDVRTLDLTERQARAFSRIEMKSALSEAQAADTALVASEQAREASAEALQLISDDFRSGKGHIFDLLGAEETLRNTEFGAMAARTQKARSIAMLRLALGMNLLEEN